MEIRWRDSARALEQQYRQEKQVHRRTRLYALWLLRTGKSLAEVSRLLSVNYRSLQRWVAWYRAGGLAGVLRRTPGGRRNGQQGRLTGEQLKQAGIKGGDHVLEVDEMRLGWQGQVRQVWVSRGVKVVQKVQFVLMGRTTSSDLNFRYRSCDSGDSEVLARRPSCAGAGLEAPMSAAFISSSQPEARINRDD